MTDRREQILDEWLVLRCRDGSHEAFRELVRRWHPRLLGYARRLTGQEDAAADVMQEVWMAVARSIGKLLDVSSLRQWLFRIVTRRSADCQRRRGIEEARFAPVAGDAAGEIETTCSDGVNPLDRLNREEAVVRIREGLHRLPRDRQALLWLHFVEEFSAVELAEILGIPRGTVKSRLHHTSVELRRYLERIES